MIRFVATADVVVPRPGCARRRVAVAADGHAIPLWSEVWRGILAFAEEAGWQLVREPDSLVMSPRSAAACPADGLIAAVGNGPDLERLKRTGRPLVSLMADDGACGVPTVAFDDVGIGRMAAGHLLEAGYRQFAFYGVKECRCSAARWDGFSAVLRKHGHTGRRLDARGGKGRRALAEAARLDDWLADQPGPVGILAANDPRALLVVEAASRIGRDVPDDIGVLGIGDQRDLCEAITPRLSSINRDGGRAGRQAALLLKRLMDHAEPPADHDRRIPPAGVSARSSTTGPPPRDRLVADVIHYMMHHLDEGFCVKQLLQRFRVSRRKLERAFRDVVRATPHEHLMRLRIERATTILAAEPRRSLASVAAACGFTDARHLRRVLRAAGLTTPTGTRLRMCR